MWVDKDEYAKIASIIGSYPNKPNRGFVFTANNFYLCTNITEDGEFKIRTALPIVGNEDLINTICNGKRERNFQTTSNIKDFTLFIGEVQSRGGATGWDVSDTEGNVQLGRNGELDPLAQREESNSGTDNGTSGKVRYNQGGLRRAEQIVKELGVVPNKRYDAETLERVFNQYNTNEVNKRLAKRVFEVLKDYIVNVYFVRYSLMLADGTILQGSYDFVNNAIAMAMLYFLTDACGIFIIWDRLFKARHLSNIF